MQTRVHEWGWFFYSMNISFGYFTNRLQPRFQWFADALCKQIGNDIKDVEVVLIDYWALPHSSYAYDPEVRIQSMKDIVADRFKFIHYSPSPCAMQGYFRQTKRDLFCASNARNTFLMVASHPYLVGVDDLSVPVDGWIDQVRHAADHKYVVCGAYKKVKGLFVTDGTITSYSEFPEGIDSRWRQGNTSGIVPIGGGQFYGSSFGVPLDMALKVNGFDLYCDMQAAEDYDFGIRLERAGAKIFFNRNMLTLESEEGHHLDQPLPRNKKFVPYDRLPESLKAFYTAGLDSDHVMLQSVLRERRITTLSRHDLRKQRAKYEATRLFDLPEPNQVDWRDGQPLSEM